MEGKSPLRILVLTSGGTIGSDAVLLRQGLEEVLQGTCNMEEVAGFLGIKRGTGTSNSASEEMSGEVSEARVTIVPKKGIVENVVRALVAVGRGMSIEDFEGREETKLQSNVRGAIVDLFPRGKIIDWNGINLDVERVMSLDSTKMETPEQLRIARAVFEGLKDHDAVIITHGTDTLEYLGTQLSFMLQNLDKPVIITGAEKPPNDPESNALRNLRDSIIFAVDVQNRSEKGQVFVVFGGRVMNACWTFEVKPGREQAYDPMVRPIAILNDGEVNYTDDYQLVYVPRSGKLKLNTNFDSVIEAIILYPQTRTGQIENAVDGGAHGMVLDGYHSYGLNPSILEVVRNISSRIPVVLTRFNSLPVSPPGIYGVSLEANNAGVIFGLGTEPFILSNLMFTLGSSEDIHDVAFIRERFYRNYENVGQNPRISNLLQFVDLKIRKDERFLRLMRSCNGEGVPMQRPGKKLAV